MARLFSNDPARLTKAKKFLTYLIWLQCYLPISGIYGRKLASQKDIAVFLTGKCGIPSKKSEIGGIVRYWPLPSRHRMSFLNRQSFIKTLAENFDDMFGDTIVQPEIPVWFFEAARVEAVDAADDSGLKPGEVATALYNIRTFCSEVGRSPGRGGKVRDIGRVKGNSIWDMDVGVVEQCEASGILVDKGDDGQKVATRRCGMARRFRDVAESGQLTRVASPSMELGGRVDAGPKTASDHTMNAWSWRRQLIGFFRECGQPAAFEALERAFVAEDRSWIESVDGVDRIKYALDLACAAFGEVTMEHVRDRWVVDSSLSTQNTSP